MPDDLVEQRKPLIPALLHRLGLEKVSPRDKFTIEYSSNFLTAVVKRENGHVETVRMHVKQAGFKEMTAYNPDAMSKADRDDVVRKLRSDGLTQSQIADRLGIAQTTVSNVLRK